ncbi:MAG TPA: transposase [Planctomycetaceae bacterium]|nr:transposase [Planctomycetaceae bacterium]
MLTSACFRSLRRYDAASRTEPNSQLTDDQWFLIEDLFDWQPPSRAGGRPPTPPRAVFEALLWMLRTGGPWKYLPAEFPSESTCRRRLKDWTESGVLVEVWARLVELSDELGWVDWKTFIADGTFCKAKKGVNSSATVAKGPERQLSF